MSHKCCYIQTQHNAARRIFEKRYTKLVVSLHTIFRLHREN